jgi:hypothetical protein
MNNTNLTNSMRFLVVASVAIGILILATPCAIGVTLLMNSEEILEGIEQASAECQRFADTDPNLSFLDRRFFPDDGYLCVLKNEETGKAEYYKEGTSGIHYKISDPRNRPYQDD